MKNGIEDLRNHLFATLEALQDAEKPMELDRAKTVADVAQTIINSAKVEVDLLRVSGGNPDSAFFTRKALPAPSHARLSNAKGTQS